MMVIIIDGCGDVAGVAVTDMEVTADVCSDVADVSVLLMNAIVGRSGGDSVSSNLFLR